MRNTLKKAAVAAFIIAAAYMAATAGVHTHPAGTPVADDPYSTSCMPSAGTETASITECATECITDTVLPYTEISLPVTGTSGLPTVDITESIDTEVPTETPAEDAVETDTEEITEHTATEDAEETAAESEEAADASGTEAPSEEESKNTTTEAEATESGTTAPEYTYTEVSDTMYATVDLNVRSGPSAAFAVTGALENGEAVTVTAQCNETGWYRIRYGGGAGYVSGKYLSTDAPERPETAVADVEDTQSMETTETAMEAVTESVTEAVTEAAETECVEEDDTDPAEARVGEVTGTAIDADAADTLEDVNLEIYTVLKEWIRDAAEGKLESSIFTVSVTRTYEQLGVDNEHDARSAIKELASVSSLLRCLKLDCPYWLYWHDHGDGAVISRKYTTSEDGTAMTLKFTWKWPIMDYYETSEEYTFDGSAMAEAAAALKNAEKIVSRYEGLSDIEKLRAYAGEICSLASYGKDSEGNVYNAVNVFDGDESTNVVCAGFSKAFLYLCDLSDFDNACCYYVCGYTAGGGYHAWNVVRIGDDGYMVDLTAYNRGRDAFLLPADSGSFPSYSFTIPSMNTGSTTASSLSYEDYVVEMLPEEVLAVTVKAR